MRVGAADEGTCGVTSALRSARLAVNLIGSAINYANRLIGSSITSQSTGGDHVPLYGSRLEPGASEGSMTGCLGTKDFRAFGLSRRVLQLTRSLDAVLPGSQKYGHIYPITYITLCPTIL